MKDFQLDEKVKKKKASLINALAEGKPETPEVSTAQIGEVAIAEEESVKARKVQRKRKITGFTLDPIARDRLAAMAMVEEKNMSRIVEELVNKLFEQKWSEWDEDTKRFLLKKFPRIIS